MVLSTEYVKVESNLTRTTDGNKVKARIAKKKKKKKIKKAEMEDLAGIVASLKTENENLVKQLGLL